MPNIFKLYFIVLIISLTLSHDLRSQNIPDLIKKSDSLNTLSEKYSADSTIYAIKLANDALLLAREASDRRQEALALVNLAEGNLYNDVYDKALAYNLEALEIFEQLQNPADEALALNSLGSLYYDVSDGENSLHYYELALSKLKGTQDSVRISRAYNAVGLVNFLLKRFPEALMYFEQAYQLSVRIGNKERIASCIINIGDVKIALGQHKEGLEWLDKAIQLSIAIDDVLKQAEARNTVARVYLSEHRFAEAENQILEAQKLLTRSHSNTRNEILLLVAANASRLYEANHNDSKALQYFKLYDSIRDRISSDSKKNSLSQMRLSLARQKEEREIARLTAERELRVMQRNAVAVGIIFLSVFGFFAFSRERKLRTKEKQLAATRQALTQADLDRISIEKEALDAKIEYKNSELTNLALHVSQRNDMVRSFLDELNSLKAKTPAEMVTQLSKTVKQFSDKQEINKEAESFHVNVENENKDFFFNLSQQFPDLTENEKRLCAQARLNLSLKDIASINNISVKSVEMARYRLRKKFNLDHEENLSDFLRKF